MPGSDFRFRAGQDFLDKVPLFRKQLPKADLPRVARALEKKVGWPYQRGYQHVWELPFCNFA